MDNTKTEKIGKEFSDWLEQKTRLGVKSIKNYYYVVVRLLNFCKDDITIEEINKFIARHERKFTSGWAVRAAIIWYLNFANLRQWIPEVKQVRSKGRKKPPSLITYKDLKRLFFCFDDATYRDVFAIQALTGCRQIEALLIRKKGVQFRDNDVLIMVSRKGGQYDSIIFPDIKQAHRIFSRPRYKGKKYLFLPENCQKLTRDEILILHYDSVRQAYFRAWRRACKKAGLPAYSSHDARRALIRAVYTKHGVYAAQKVARHKRIETTAMYIEGLKIDIAKVISEAITDE